ncbi:MULTISPECIES: cysteine--tRNA ligase [Crateriforma]|uniref:Cysteine--tRNA ligase n=1 Tax=Crateriforma conspicua TaxID=2527996 RepID=A0A5C5YA14_9PLAN|nr:MULTISPECIES: cysteine--tRNA ligase [Crateriforma]TWT71301.1 Cysteine--tRNA ligase [Crateriforma conspicua]TWU64764.1 Cysteine--tRNA ligase [Crateriforma conspicua]
MSTATASDASTPTTPAEKPEIRIYNTLSKTKEAFQPLRPPSVGMYLCGPTVYAEAHIGHMVGPVIFDCVKRFLTYSGYDVTWVVNITDVDDKLIAKGRERGIPMSQIAVEMTADYLANLKELGVNQINHLPRATDHMPQIIAFIQTLEAKGHAYAVDGDVFFDVMKDPSYGQLSNRSVDSQQGEGGDAAAKKRSPGDFALWKSAKSDEPSWDSPWGAGRPGWHIECSAMSHEILGETFDIHGGGLDLVFPHHENERAQSSCCHGAPMVKYWMHNGLMRAGEKGKVGGRSDRESTADDAQGKISRSKGAGGLAELIRRHTGERIRFFLLRTHYRSTIVFGEDGLQEAGTALEGFYRFFDRYEQITGSSFYDLPAARTRFDGGVANPKDDALLKDVAQLRSKYLAAMDDDFNTGAAISQLFDLLRLLNRHIDTQKLGTAAPASPALETLTSAATVLRELTSVLGLFLKPVAASAGGDDGDAELLDHVIGLLIDLRKEARANKDYAMGDAIRDRLGEIGVALLDSKDGTTWEKK